MDPPLGWWHFSLGIPKEKCHHPLSTPPRVGPWARASWLIFFWNFSQKKWNAYSSDYFLIDIWTVIKRTRVLSITKHLIFLHPWQKYSSWSTFGPSLNVHECYQSPNIWYFSIHEKNIVNHRESAQIERSYMIFEVSDFFFKWFNRVYYKNASKKKIKLLRFCIQK